MIGHLLIRSHDAIRSSRFRRNADSVYGGLETPARDEAAEDRTAEPEGELGEFEARAEERRQELVGTRNELSTRTPELRRQEQVPSREPQSAGDRARDRDLRPRLAESLTVFLERPRSPAESLDVSNRRRIFRLYAREVQVSKGRIIIHHSIPIPNLPEGGSGPSKSNADAPESIGHR